MSWPIPMDCGMIFCNILLNWTLMCLTILHLSSADESKKVLFWSIFFEKSVPSNDIYLIFMKQIIVAFISVHLHIPVQILWFCDYYNKGIFLVKCSLLLCACFMLILFWNDFNVVGVCSHVEFAQQSTWLKPHLVPFTIVHCFYKIVQMTRTRQPFRKCSFQLYS